MASSSLATSKFTVRRRPAVLVAPAALTPRELKRLSDIDDQGSLRTQVPMILFYQKNEAMGRQDPAQVFRGALARALVPYYPFAGRLRELEGGKLAVDCTAEGVLFVEADADVPLEHFGDTIVPPFLGLEELIFDIPGSSAIVNTPLLLFQVTRLACGGFVLAVRLNHTMADGHGLTQFLGAVAELARGAQAPIVQPVWERELLESRRTSQSPALKLDNSGDAADSNCIHGSDGLVGTGSAMSLEKPVSHNTQGCSIMLPTDDMILRSLFFGPREVAAIRAQLPPQLQKRATRFDAVVGWLWKFRTKALAPTDPNERMALILVVNARGRSRIPVGYYGNAFAYPVLTSTAGELCANPVSYAVELVKKAKNQVDMEYMRSEADLIALRRGQVWCFTPSMYGLSDQTRTGFDDIDFGWGKPVYGGPAEPVSFPVLPWAGGFLIPSKNTNGENGMVLPLYLPRPAMDRLVEEMGQLLRPPSDVNTLQQARAFPVKRSAL